MELPRQPVIDLKSRLVSTELLVIPKSSSRMVPRLLTGLLRVTLPWRPQVTMLRVWLPQIDCLPLTQQEA